MKINAIENSYSLSVLDKISKAKAVTSKDFSNNRCALISFKGGNPRHIMHQISELQLFGQSSGGVGTVGNDYFFALKDIDRLVENIPLYNQDVQYVPVEDASGKVIGIKQNGVSLRRIPSELPQGHPFKGFENKVFVTPKEITKDVDLAEFLKLNENRKNVFILDEIKTGSMGWGLETDVPIGLYKAQKNEQLKTLLKNKGWSDEMIEKIDITFTYVDGTASMPKPYADGSYMTATGTDAAKKLSSDWFGKPYPKEAKATAELMPAMKEVMGFDPGYILCSDAQAMPLIQYAADKNAAGLEYWRGKYIGAVGHNLNDGYIQSMGVKDAIVTIGTPEEIKKIINSKEYADSLLKGNEEKFLKSLLPKEIFDARGQVNSVMFPIYYAEKGYVPMFTTVSNGYYKSIIENELVSPAIYERLKALSEQGRFRGIINVLMDPLTSGFTTNGLTDGYKNDCKIKLKTGEEVIIPKFLAFDEAKPYDLSAMREVKRQNKISLLKRLNVINKDAQLFSQADNKWLESGTGYSKIVTGNLGKKFEIIGSIDEKYLKALENGKDVPMFVSWGRGDFQKGMDTGLEAFKKMVKNTGDTSSIYVFGGDMSNLKNIVELVKEMNKDPLYKGRVLCLNGWTPGSSFAAAGDYAVLASRFAPCELTDLECMKKGCVPIVPKVQGMDQKVFDPMDISNSKYMNGYKGKHEYYMAETDAYNAARDDAKVMFDKVKQSLKDKFSKDYKKKIGTDIPEDLLNKEILNSEKYKQALQNLRDSIISDELSECMETAVKDRNTETANKIWKNHVDLKTTWEENGWMNPSGSTSGEEYRKLHFQNKNSRNLEKSEVLKLDISHLTDAETVINGAKRPSFGSKLKKFFTSKGGKWAVAGVSVVAVAGITAGLIKSSQNKKLQMIQEEDAHLSALV